MNRAGAAQARTATELRTGHLQLLADDPQQRRIVGRLDGHIPPIDSEIWHRVSPSGAGSRLRRQFTFLGIGRHPPELYAGYGEHDPEPI